MDLLEIIFWGMALLIFYTYIGYGIILYVSVAIMEWFVKRVEIRKDESSSIIEHNLPAVTLLVAAYNEEEVAEEKILNSLDLDYPDDKLHLIWVTDGSTDKTNDIISRYPKVILLHQNIREGKSAAINRAIPFVKTPIVVFSDANAMLNKDAIRIIANAFSDSKVGCVAGEKRVVYGDKDGASSSGEGIYWRYESKLKELDSRLYSAVGAAGELYAIRTNLYNNVEKSVLLDDFILSMRIAMKGYRIRYCRDAYAVEFGAKNMKEEEKRKVRISAGGLQSVIMLTPLLNIFKYGFFSFQYVSHRLLRWTITPIALFALMPLNIALALRNAGNIYSVLLIFHALFYFLSIAGYLMAEREVKRKIIFVPYYFMFMNLSVLKGFRYLYKKRGTGVWEKSERAKKQQL